MELLNPLIVHVSLTFVLISMMAYSRTNAIKTREVHPRDIALREPNWPKTPTKIANAFHNQLETPILFYVLILLLLITKQGDALQIYLAWAYVAARLVHVGIHLTTNNVLARFAAFGVSLATLIVMWIRFIIAVNL